MPYYHCEKCHHEFENIGDKKPKCGWCGSNAYILEEKTPLEKMGESWNTLLEKIAKIS